MYCNDFARNLNFKIFARSQFSHSGSQTSTYNSYSHLVNQFKAVFYYVLHFVVYVKLWYYNRDLIGAIFVEE